MNNSGQPYKSTCNKNNTYDSICSPDDVQERNKMAIKANNKMRKDKDHRNNYDKRGNNGMQNNNFKEDVIERSKFFIFYYL